MSIQALKKVSLIGERSQKTKILEELQSIGKIHLMDVAVPKEGLNQAESARQHSAHSLSGQLKKAINYLEQSPFKRKQIKTLGELDLKTLIDQILKNQKRKRDLLDKRDRLNDRIQSLTPWGNFHLPPGSTLAGFKLWFYILPRRQKKALAELKLPWHIVHSDSHQHWVVVIAPEEPHEHLLPVARIHTGSKSLEAVKKALFETEIALEDVEVDRQGLTRYLDQLNRYKHQAADTSALKVAESLSLDITKVFVICGWYPEKHIQALTQYCDANVIALVVDEVVAQDQPPTLMDNPSAIKGGELLVGFYQTPSYGSWDPSLMVFLSFSLFFAMILSDAGYALILIGFLSCFWLKMGKSQTGKLLRPLLATVSGVSLIWGVLVGSYFGVAPNQTSILAYGHLLDVNDFNSMMTLSMACGVLHLFIANVVQIKLAWGSTRALLHLGWVIVLAGASLLGLSAGDSTLGLSLLIVGLLVVFAGGSNQKIDSAKALLFRFLGGLQALTNITNMFGDVLSYLRLFALGLASASLALTFNGLAKDAFSSDSGFGLLFGILILVVGHCLNLLLGIVSGVVHGLRLNYIEFYKWALYGEGYPFKAFKKSGA